MKIAQIAPLAESCPPRFYGGTERIVSALVEELVSLGHEVTLFASGDSTTKAELVRCSDMALRLNPAVKDTLPYTLIMLDEVRRRAAEFDILHFHTDLTHFPIARPFAQRTVTTLHGRLDLPDLRPFYAAFPEMPLVSITDQQRLPLPRGRNWVGTVPHGLPPERFPFVAAPRGDYLAFIGRISPEKGPVAAVEIARRTGMRLKMAAKIDRVDQSYWDEVVHPLVRGNPNVEFLGEINDREKAALLGDARALLFPIDWPEPFGLVMIEAMACGTPVLAMNCGAVPEVIEDGISGRIVADVDGAVAALPGLLDFDRRTVRAAFEARFTARRMARDYVDIYERQIGARQAPSRHLIVQDTDLQAVA